MARSPLTVAAGCTDLYPLASSRTLPGEVLDITAIPGLRGISRNGGWRIGATTTWTDILRADLPPAFDGLKQAAREVGSVQIQNAGTVAGNLCTASPAGDSIPPLMTLNAEVELQSTRGTRRLPLGGFLTGARRTDRAEDELLTAVHVPEASGTGGGHFLKLGARRYLVISIAMTAARLEIAPDGTLSTAAIAVGACSPVAVRLAALEQALTGRPPHEAEAVVTRDRVAPYLDPIADIRADAGYRIDAAVELIRRCLGALARPGARAA